MVEVNASPTARSPATMREFTNDCRSPRLRLGGEVIPERRNALDERPLGAGGPEPRVYAVREAFPCHGGEVGNGLLGDFAEIFEHRGPRGRRAGMLFGEDEEDIQVGRTSVPASELACPDDGKAAR